jgi:hypothetical protein
VCHKCILEQFSLEYVFYDFLTQFCGRTYNPEEADFFYLPLIRDAEYRTSLDARGPHSRAPSLSEQALLGMLWASHLSFIPFLTTMLHKYRRYNGEE